MNELRENIISDPHNHTGSFYGSFESFIQKAETWIKGMDLKGAERIYGKQELTERLIQRIAAETRSHYIREKAMTADRTDEAIPVGRIKNGISYNKKTGVVTCSLGYKLRTAAIASAHFFGLAAYILKGIFRSQRIARKVNLFYGLTSGEVIREGSDKAFGDFIFNGALKELFTGPLTVIKLKNAPLSVRSDQLVYCENPLEYTFQHADIRFWERLRLIAIALRAWLFSLFLICKAGAYTLLAKDLIAFDLVNYLDKREILGSYILTVSHYTDQPLYLRHAQRRKFRVHMIYYSQNSIPRVFKFDNVHSHLPEWRHIKADCHWVWTEYYKQYLRTVGISSEIKVVGPILFYMSEGKIPPQSDQVISIAVFDVTPLSPEKAVQMGVTVYDYYRFENMREFLLDILEFAQESSEKSEKSIKILLKHKRLPKGGHHDQRYLDLIKELIAENSYFQIVEESMNVFSLIDSTAFSVVYPFTSTYIVSDHLKKDALIYDPTGMLVPTYDTLPHVRFASGKEELHAMMEAILRARTDNNIQMVK